MLLLTMATALAADPEPTTLSPTDAEDVTAGVEAPEATTPEAPPEAEALSRMLSMRHAVACDELEAGLADPVPALQWAVATIQQPPWAAMHAAECLAVGHGDEVADDLVTWVKDPALKGLGMQTIGLIPRLSDDVAVRVARAALDGDLADRARKAAEDDVRPAVRAVVTP